MIYWDTNALVKQFLAEVGTEEVLAFRSQDLPHATSMITYSETFLPYDAVCESDFFLQRVIVPP